MKEHTNRMKAIRKALKKKEPCNIGISWRTDGLVEWDLPGGKTELITEAEYKARGGSWLGG